MKAKHLHFAAGLVLGAALFGGGTALAAGLLAEPSAQTFYVNGQQVQFEAYAINGNNYVKLRDVGRAINFGVTYDGKTNSVWLESQSPYVEETPATPKPTTGPKTLTGDSWAREDFSQQANPAIFTGAYTRAAYNAARQTILDKETIVAGNNDKGYNPDYTYAYVNGSAETLTAMEDALAALSGYPSYATGAEPGITNLYAYPNYFICTAKYPAPYAEAAAYTDSFIKSLAELSDREKVRQIDFYVADRLTYDVDGFSSPRTVLTSDSVQGGNCMAYAHSFAFLCARAGIPNLLNHSEDHQWNQVYVDGQWWHVDVGGDDVGDDVSMRSKLRILKADDEMQGIDYVNIAPEVTLFVKELLVPGSTK